MKYAHLTEDQERALNEFEQQLGVVLVAYKPEAEDKEPSAASKQNPTNHPPVL
ncbi:hypothetical protein PU629_08205 [Pullulanibacillus sp. KACC 23026]|uniref:hypothetical protein n=1 Tax=Pullulanibacillus sp. KACC 23026 TaxID=3028315 RepID=UPI0023AF98D0|nr:hypothetical protein [Pullulanibacillus sp. KACC 23026]WEG14329.1 hypothetical protein PU629_08205 [Pullulanibacillus sp. KACC 23026]